jgi:subtilisin family serine protease
MKTNVMKQLRYLIIVCITLISSCQTDLTQDNESLFEDSVIHELEPKSRAHPAQASQIIINYDGTLSELEKEVLRNQYGVIDFKTCECADPNLELWILPGNANGGAVIEEVTASANGDSGVEDAGFNPKVDLIGTTNQMAFGPADVSVARNKVVPANQNVTIAVLDTGIDYNYFGFTQPFLYNNTNNPNTCKVDGMVDYYGWDFVNQDNDPFDEGYGHGTRVSHLISKTLQEKNVNFQILPVKVFNQNGEGTYFDILCGFKYATNNSDVNIINMSFGWYDDQFQLLEKFITEAQEDVLITTSAGNYGVNTDQILHFPSGYENSNIIATAALQGYADMISLASFSNYGTHTVDVAAKGSNIPFYISPSDAILLAGTSYANAYMTAHAATQYTQGISVPVWVDSTLESTIYHSNLQMLKHSSYLDD